MTLWQDQSGQSMAEYGLLTALVAVVSIVAVKALGGSVAAKFAQLAKAIATK
ncbi:MAG: Flp family type IVb pilin [Firmicutes bacterium]|nr:Flp family type IVb pilin [Bacillota bacterium]